MSKKEYVHRDVSSGNILVVDGKGKLTDLEYAQIIGTGGHHCVRTVRLHVYRFLTAYPSYSIYQGTIAFMAVEVAAEKYTFTAHSHAALKQLRDKNHPVPKAFVYNPLHDIESLWWVLLWIVLCKEPSPSTIPSDEQQVNRKLGEKVLRAFPQRLDEGSRAWLLRLGLQEFYFEYTAHISPSLAPYLYHLLGIKVYLVDSYTAAEATLFTGGDIDRTAWSTTHQNVIKEINEVFTDMECSDFTLSPISFASLKYKRRHGLSDDHAFFGF